MKTGVYNVEKGKLSVRNGLCLIVFLSFNVMAVDYSQYEYGSSYYHACKASALAIHRGRVVKIEFKEEDGDGVYEFDIRTPDNRDWDIECIAKNNTVIEVEEEVSSVQHPAFFRQQKVTEKQARAVALAAWPGDIIEVEYEIEPDGKASYEFDIDTYQGAEMKVEVDAATGEISEQNEELWQEGYE